MSFAVVSSESGQMVYFGNSGAVWSVRLWYLVWMLQSLQYVFSSVLFQRWVSSAAKDCVMYKWKKGRGRNWTATKTCIKIMWRRSRRSYLAASLFCFVLFWSIFVLQQWWQIKLKQKWAKLYSEWSFICMLGGLTLCPIVNGDRKVSFYVLF